MVKPDTLKMLNALAGEIMLQIDAETKRHQTEMEDLRKKSQKLHSQLSMLIALQQIHDK